MTVMAVEQLPHPETIYASAQRLREGRVQALGFGLFDHADDHFPAAWDRLASRVLAQLPDRPAAPVLLLHSGQSSLRQALARRGYEVASRALTPGWPAVASAPAAVAWAPAPEEEGRFAAVVGHEMTRGADFLALFSGACRALAEGGVLVLADEFNRVWDTPEDDGRPRLRHLLALAQRCGFVLQVQEDLSAGAALTFDYYQQIFATQGDRLRRELVLQPAGLDAVAAANRHCRQRYAEGRRGFLLLRFVKQLTSRWRVERVTAADYPAVAGLFERVFGQPLSRPFWDWKYGDDRGRAVAARLSGRLVAHYGSVSRHIAYFGAPVLGCQITDVMVEPGERGVLTRRGPFFLAAASFPEAYVGFGARYLIGFGFPNSRAMAVAARLELYGAVGKMVEMYWPLEPQRRTRRSRLHRLIDAGSSELERCLNPLWQGMAADLRQAIVGVRDVAWVRYRYLDHPHQEYHVLLATARLTGRPRGIVVLRRDGCRCELLDVIAPLRRVPRLIQAARQVAAEWQAEELYCWISAAFAGIFEGCGGRRRELDVMTPTSIWVEGPDPEALRDRWWLMGGDTDFH